VPAPGMSRATSWGRAHNRIYLRSLVRDARLRSSVRVLEKKTGASIRQGAKPPTNTRNVLSQRLLIVTEDFFQRGAKNVKRKCPHADTSVRPERHHVISAPRLSRRAPRKTASKLNSRSTLPFRDARARQEAADESHGPW